jgi:hypothetical protein
LRAQFRQYPWEADAARLRETAERLCRLALYRLRRTLKPQLAVIVALAFASGSFGYLMMGELWSRPAVVAASTPAAPAPTAMGLRPPMTSTGRKNLIGSSSRSVWPTSSRSRAQGRRRRRGLQGRWVRLDYPIVSFGKQSFGKITYDTVESTAHFNSAFPGTVIALFDDQRWDAQLRKHRPSERLVAYCQFATIDKVPFLANIYRLRFYGTGRELPLY